MIVYIGRNTGRIRMSDPSENRWGDKMLLTKKYLQPWYIRWREPFVEWSVRIVMVLAFLALVVGYSFLLWYILGGL